jgi:hypothetical protein
VKKKGLALQKSRKGLIVRCVLAGSPTQSTLTGRREKV